MRVNVYAEETTDRVEIISKTTEAGTFTGLRIYLELPISMPGSGGHHITHRGPFIHGPGGDDDSSAVTFWGKQDLRHLLRKALAELDRYYDRKAGSSGNKVQGCTDNQAGIISYNEVGARCKHDYDMRTCPVCPESKY